MVISTMYFKEMPKAFEPYEVSVDITQTLLSELEQNGLLPFDKTSVGGKIICEDSKGNKFIAKPSTNIEIVMFTKVFPMIQNSGVNFKVLELPHYRNIIEISEGSEKRKFIVMNYYKNIEGGFNNSWSEIEPHNVGGRASEATTATQIIDLVEDLASIDVSVLDRLNLSSFDFQKWTKENFPFLVDILIYRRILDKDLANRAFSILSSPGLFHDSKRLITNGDFYPRNIIQAANQKLVVVDWEGRTDYQNLDYGNGFVSIDQRNSFINYIENHLAFFYIHMWANYSFQKNLVKGFVERFNLSYENVQAALLIRTLEQSLIWPDDLARRQIEMFANSLDGKYIEDLIR